MVPGGTLSHPQVPIRHTRPAPPENVASHLMANFMNALKYIHESGVCHRDLKPDNMLLVNAIPKVCPRMLGAMGWSPRGT